MTRPVIPALTSCAIRCATDKHTAAPNSNRRLVIKPLPLENSDVSIIVHCRSVILNRVAPQCNNIVIRATNWLGRCGHGPAGDPCDPGGISAGAPCPAGAARGWPNLYSRETWDRSGDRVSGPPLELYPATAGPSGFDCAILLQNAFEAALVARLAGIPRRIGYDRDGRGWLLTDAIPVPLPARFPGMSASIIGIAAAGRNCRATA